MPRYEIRDTSDDSLTYVEGNLPLNLMLSQAAGTYRAKVMSAEEATDIVVPTLTASIAEASLDVGDTATLTTNAPTGSTYQWKLDGTPISGATSATYVTASEGSLTCVVDAGPQSVETAGVAVGAAATGGITYVGYKALGLPETTANRTVDLTTLDAFGSAPGTGDGGTLAEGDVVLAVYGQVHTLSGDHAIPGYTAIIAPVYDNSAVDMKLGLYGKEMAATPDTSFTVDAFGNDNGDSSVLIYVIALRGANFATIAGAMAADVSDSPPDQTPTVSESVIFAGRFIASRDGGGDAVSGAANMTTLAEITSDGSINDGAAALSYHEWVSGTFSPGAFIDTRDPGGDIGISFVVAPS